jgi:hypothetical protein
MATNSHEGEEEKRKRFLDRINRMGRIREEEEFLSTKKHEREREEQ